MAARFAAIVICDGRSVRGEAVERSAAAMGCDGVVLGGVTHAAEPNTDLHLSRKGLTATCVMYLPETMAATPPPPGEPPPAVAPAQPQ